MLLWRNCRGNLKSIPVLSRYLSAREGRGWGGLASQLGRAGGPGGGVG